MKRAFKHFPLASIVFLFSIVGIAGKGSALNFLDESSRGFGEEVNRDPLQIKRLFHVPADLSSSNSTTNKPSLQKNGWLGVLLQEGVSIKPPVDLAKIISRTSVELIPVLTVTGVYPHSPAGKAGVLPGDKIIAVGGEYLLPGEDNSALTHFVGRVADAGIGNELSLHILRGEISREIKVTLVAKPKAQAQLKNHPDLEINPNPNDDSLFFRLLKEKGLEKEYIRTAGEISERVSHAVSPVVKGEDYNPFRLKEVNYVLSRPMNLPLVADRMAARLRDQFGQNGKSLAGLFSEAMDGLDLESNIPVDAGDSPNGFEGFLGRLVQALGKAKKVREEALSALTADEVQALHKKVGELFSKEGPGNKNHNIDFGKDENDEDLLNFLNLVLKLDLGKLIGASMLVARALDLDQLSGFKGGAGLERVPENWIVERETNLIRLKSPQGKVLIGGKGNNVYEEHAMLIIDFGGDDRYLNNAGASGMANPFAVVIDFSGDDVYLSSELFSQGSGVLGGGFLIDLSGNDRYLSNNFSQGSGFLGTGTLVDMEGNDEYLCHSYCQGSGAFGIGLLADASGNDRYSAAIFSQGFGHVKGYGALIEMAGDDHYFAGGVYSDRRQPDKAYLSMSQGFGFGMRPWSSLAGASGGIGILAEEEGNDTYIGDYFGQGASYWYALGILSDKNGNDKYVAGRYSQGAGIHFSAGVLSDGAGDDEYLSYYGVAQGCGHDLGVGFLLDHGGNDRYISGIISQGAGNGNGIGVLNDNGGNDEYYIREQGQGRGNYEKFRKLGSFGVLFDTGGGKDFYSGGEGNNRITFKTEWGILADTK